MNNWNKIWREGWAGAEETTYGNVAEEYKSEMMKELKAQKARADDA